MLNEIKLLTRLHLLSTFGLNEAKYSKDTRKRRNPRAMLAVYIFLGVLICFYTCLLSLFFTYGGAPEIVPQFLFIIASLMIFIFSVFKSATVVFSVRDYEREIVLPVKPSDIVISRFLTLYIFNVLLSAMVLIPGSIIYAAAALPSVGFYLMTAAALLVTPLIPMTLATTLGALVLAVSSRLRHRNVIAIVFSMALTIAFLVFVYTVSFSGGHISSDEMIGISSALISQASAIYSVSILYGSAVTGGNAGFYAIFAGLSAGLFAAFVAVVSKWYVSLCSSMGSAPAGKKYVMQNQTATSQLKALYKRELKRYFSSNIYVMNTGISYIIMLLFSIAVFVAGEQRVGGFFGMDGVVAAAVPFIMSLIIAISSTTSSSISMEGKNWWIVLSLPVSAKRLFDSKLMVNLTVGLPFYAVSVVLIALTLSMSFASLALLILVPLVYLIFMSVLGLAVNLRLPMMEWDSEVTVVKQSGAVMITMLIGMAAAGIPLILAILLPEPVKTVVLFAACLAVLIASVILYRKNNRTVLTEI